SLREQEVETRRARDEAEAAVPDLVKAAADQAGAVETAHAQHRAAQEKLKAVAPLLQQVRALDQRVADRDKTLVALDAQCAQEDTEIKGLVKDCEDMVASLTQIGQDRATTQA